MQRDAARCVAARGVRPPLHGDASNAGTVGYTHTHEMTRRRWHARTADQGIRDGRDEDGEEDERAGKLWGAREARGARRWGRDGGVRLRATARARAINLTLLSLFSEKKKSDENENKIMKHKKCSCLRNGTHRHCTQSSAMHNIRMYNIRIQRDERKL